MRLLAHHRSWLLSLLLAALCVLFGEPAQAQVNPLWDHYKGYLVQNSPQLVPPIPVFLRDQFGEFQHQATRMPFFANPVEKRIVDASGNLIRFSPIHDSLTHYTWWEIEPRQPFDATVRIDNQFGFQEMRVHDGVLLLNPALKNNPSPQIPERNHYKCYVCEGPTLYDPNVNIVLTDQFDTWTAFALYPRYFCNPVYKQVAGQPPHPILDAKQHYTIYAFTPIDEGTFTAVARDQFGQFQLQLTPGLHLMVPTDKLLVTDAKTSTWGRLKTLYR